MSKFNRFAAKLDNVARETFGTFERLEKKQREAQQRMKNYPDRAGIVSPEYIAEQAKARAAYYDSKAAMDKAKHELPDKARRDAANLRKELEKELFIKFAPRPDHVNMQTIELLKSGILKDSEYVFLARDAIEHENYTMARIISKQAENMANARPATEAMILREAAEIGKRDQSADYLSTFDGLTDIMNRCLNNLSMSDHWGELTRDIVEGF